MAPKPSASRTATKQTVSRGIAKKAPTIQPKKLFRLSSLSKASSSSSTSSRRGQSKDEKAVITFFRAKYQKGEMKGTFSGNVYMHGKPRYNKKQKSNEIFKAKLNEKMLGDSKLRWNDDLKMYMARVYSIEQAIMLRDSAKMVSKEDEQDLDENGPTDEDITGMFDFAEYKAKDFDFKIIKEVELDGKMTQGVGGYTFLFKDDLEALEFQFSYKTRLWHGPTDTDLTDLEEKIVKYGFNVDNFDGVDPDSDAEAAQDEE